MNNILAIIQARQNSTRLPNKVLERFSGDYLIGHIITRLKRSRHINHIMVATGDEKRNAALVKVCREELGTEVFCGDEQDVLSRFYHAAKPSSPDIIVRVTADDPLKDTQVIDRAIGIMLDSRQKGAAYDYVSNTMKPSYPEGIDIEIVTFAALSRAFHEAKLPSEREHVTPYIWKNPKLFRLHNFEHEENMSHLRWTVDFPEDLAFIKTIYTHFDGKEFSMDEILQFLKANPALSRTNKDVERNQAYNEMIKHEQ